MPPRAAPSSTSMRLARTQRRVHARSSADSSCTATRTARSKRWTRRRGCTARCRSGPRRSCRRPRAAPARGPRATGSDARTRPHARRRRRTRLAQQLPVGDHEVRTEVRAARDLGDEGPVALASELLGHRTGAGPATTSGARAVLDHARRAAATGRTISGGRAETRARRCGSTRGGGSRVEHGRERLAELQVQVHRSGPGMRDRVARGVAAECRVDGLAGEASRGIRLAGFALGCGDVALEARRPREDARLHGGLVRADAAQLRRPVGRAHDERHARMVRLEHRGMEVRDRRARRGDDHAPAVPTRSAVPSARNAARPLVDAHVQPDRADALELGRGERERLGSRPGGHDEIADALVHEGAEERHRGVARGAPPGVARRGAGSAIRSRRVGPASPGASGASGCLRSVSSVWPEAIAGAVPARTRATRAATGARRESTDCGGRRRRARRAPAPCGGCAHPARHRCAGGGGTRHRRRVQPCHRATRRCGWRDRGPR